MKNLKNTKYFSLNYDSRASLHKIGIFLAKYFAIDKTELIEYGNSGEFQVINT